jgi:hypothetical protein
VTCDGQPSFVYTSSNRAASGYVTQGKTYKDIFPFAEVSYTTVATDAPVAVQVTALWTTAITTVAIRPSNLAIIPTVTDTSVAFTAPPGAKLSIEINGLLHPLFLFVHPPDPEIPDGPGVRRYAAGIHDLGQEILQAVSGETVILEPGAVVFGRLHARNVTGVRVLGRGTLSGARLARPVTGFNDYARISPLRLLWVEGADCLVRGPCVVDGPYWLSFWRGTDAERPVLVEHIALIGWYMNTDAFQGMGRCRGRDLFACTNDDAFVVNNSRDLDVERATIFQLTHGAPINFGWNGKGGCGNIRFRDIDVIHFLARKDWKGTAAIRCYYGGDGHMQDIAVDGLRLEEPMVRLLDLRLGEHFWSVPTATVRRLSDITIRRVRADGPFQLSSSIAGESANRMIERVTLEDIVIGDKRIDTAAQIPLLIKNHTADICIRP